MQQLNEMARQVTELAVYNMLNGRTFRSKNTVVERDGNGLVMRLFGNPIARVDNTGDNLQITNAGYFTLTTKERLNGFPGVSIQQKKGQWYLNGHLWNGEWVDVKEWNEENELSKWDGSDSELDESINTILKLSGIEV